MIYHCLIALGIQRTMFAHLKLTKSSGELNDDTYQKMKNCKIYLNTVFSVSRFVYFFVPYFVCFYVSLFVCLIIFKSFKKEMTTRVYGSSETLI